MSNAVQTVYETEIPVDLVLARNGFPAGARRISSPTKPKKNTDVAIYKTGFKDFYTNVAGDAVMLDYYLKTDGGVLNMEKGIGSEYFRWKAEILGIDLDSPDSNKKQVLPKRVFVPAPETIEAKKQSNEHISLSFMAIHKYMYNKDRSPIYPHLLERGMTKEEIDKSPFTCAPKEDDINNILNIVNNYGTDTEGLPGFYENDHGAFTMKVQKNSQVDNLMIPIFNIRKQLVSFHYRGLTQSSPYWSLSSNGEKKGCSPGTPTGYWGNVNAKTIILTEGALKGYLAHIWTGLPVMYILGVSSQSMLTEALKDAKAAGVENIIMAFDMDYDSKSQVKEAVDQVKEKIQNVGISYHVITWNHDYNGIDDYLLYAKQNGVIDKVIAFIRNIVNK